VKEAEPSLNLSQTMNPKKTKDPARSSKKTPIWLKASQSKEEDAFSSKYSMYQDASSILS